MSFPFEHPLTEPLSDPMLPRLFRIRRVKRELPRVFTLHLDPADNGPPAPIAPGQFNMLYAFGTGEVPVSLAGAGPRKSLMHTVRALGTVTEALERLTRGHVIGLRGPFGIGWPLTDAVGKDVLLIAGGLGLPPIWSALQHLLAHRQRYRRVSLLYGSRTPVDILFRRELAELQQRPDLHVAVTVDRAGADWSGQVGVVVSLVARAPFDPMNSIAMICGPEVMMRFTVRELKLRGLQDDQIFLSMERNMKCAVGFCGHCQFGPTFICKNGPVFRYDRIVDWLGIQEL